jgi:hypothetical protein
MEKVKKSSNSVCYISSSEPFRIYSCILFEAFFHMMPLNIRWRKWTNISVIYCTMLGVLIASDHQLYSYSTQDAVRIFNSTSDTRCTMLGVLIASDHQLYSYSTQDAVRIFNSTSDTRCTMLGVLIASDHQLYSYSTQDAVRIVNSFITIPITRNYNRSQLFLPLCNIYTAYNHLYCCNFNHL